MSDGLTKAIPRSAGELKDNLKALFENKSHMKSVTVNPTNNNIEVRLDGSAHFFGKHDFFMPIKTGKSAEAKALIGKLLSEMNQGYPPSDTEAMALYDLIDPTAH